MFILYWGMLNFITPRVALSAFAAATVATVAGARLMETGLQAMRLGSVLSKLKLHASVINTGRGEHVMDDDLRRSIAEGQVSYAVLDVFRQEPLPTSHAFWRMPEVTLTPHISARTLREATIGQIADKIQALERAIPSPVSLISTGATDCLN